MYALDKIIGVLDKVGIFSRWTNVIGVSGFFIMICLTFVDVIMRYVFNSPIRYTTELVEVMMITSIFLAIAHTQNVKGHVSVDVITQKLSARPRLILEFITTILGLLPMATGISFDFHKFTLVFGGESTQWWGPMAVAVIFGLGVATLLTLIVVPALCSLAYDFQNRGKGKS